MEFQYKLDYSKLSDKQIVEKILAEPHDEEAEAFYTHTFSDKVPQHILGFCLNFTI